MSDLRRGCIGSFVFAGLISAASNHGIIGDVGNDVVMVFAWVGFVFAVAIFGRRAA